MKHTTLLHRVKQARAAGLLGDVERVDKARAGVAAVAGSARDPEKLEGVSLTVHGGTAAVVWNTRTPRDTSARTVDEALREAQVDTLEWMVERYTVNKWDGMHVVDGVPHVTELWQVKVYLRRRPATANRAMIDAVREAIAGVKPPTYARPKVPNKRTGLMLELCPHDVHVGLLSWPAETGQAYDSKIAVRVFERVTHRLLELAGAEPGRYESIAIVVGNDLLHADNQTATTTKGTPQDVDGRLYRSYTLALQSLIRTIDELRGLTKDVRVIVIPGNHDRVSSWMLGTALAQRYHADRRVTVDESPAIYKVIEWGNALIGLGHGDDLEHRRAQEVMHDLRPELMGSVIKSRLTAELHLGHYHKLQVDSQGHVVVRVVPSISGRGAWTTRRGYRTPPGMAGFAHCKADGASVASYVARPEHGLYGGE
jgi:hypothetical protein